ncbi:MAG: ABC transporter substrate-binding protein [Desulfobacteraceae bacterium]|nr:penicillin-binding protein activator [Desulfobacteraceae bacterium]MBC2754893.1 ABC transporter substrate-binding protein [Desulfobacteraceae bacterium]
MDRITHVFIVILLVFCLSCAEKEGGARFFWQISPEKQLFDSAQQQYQDGAYNEALPLFQEYLSQFPDTEQAPTALLKVGMISVYLEQYEKAISVFNRVQSIYPESPYAREAGVGKLAVYYKTGEYQQVTLYAGNVLSEPLAREQLFRVNIIVGDSYLAIKSPLEAYFAYLNAFQDAKAKETNKVISRLKTAISLMDASDLSNELATLEGRPPGGYLMYQLGINYMEEGYLGDAVATFSSFIENYPHHENVAQAEKLIAALEASVLTDRHVIGCLLPMTGKYEKFGHQALEGIEFALAQFARQQGVSSIRILVKDTASDPLVAQQGLYELADSNVSAIIGPIATAEYASIQAQELRIPMITLTQKSGVTEAGDYIFRNFLTPRMQIKALVEYASGTLKAKKFAILYPDESYGDVYMNLFWDEVMLAGGKVVGVEAYNPEKTHFSDPIKKLVGLYYDIPEDLIEEPSLTPLVYIESEYPEVRDMAPDVSDILTGYDTGNWHDELIESINVSRLAAARKTEEEEGPEPIIDFDAVFIPDSPNKAGLIIPQLVYYDVNDVYLLGTNLWHSDKLINMAKYHIQGAILPEGFFEQSTAEHVHRFVTGFKYTYGNTPGFTEAVSYDTAWILFDLVSRPDIRFRPQLKRELLAMAPFEGVTGTTVFDAGGEAVKDIYLLKVKGRRFKEITEKGPANQFE